MKRGEYSYMCCCYRMNEFYDWDELDYTVRTVMDNNLEPHDWMEFLDMQTRTNYVTGVDPEPEIRHYLLDFVFNKSNR